MYSGTTIRTKSGNIIGVHQRIDRLARRNVKVLLSNPAAFPTAQQILHFEGKNGPDGLKRKSPGTDEPWHFIDPDHEGSEHELYTNMSDHITNLRVALNTHNTVRAAFEAAWLAHVVVDGLTPAHHHPYAEKLAEIRGGQHHSTRATKLQKAFMPGDTMQQVLKNNWAYWGKGGLMTTHLGFELGVALAVSPPYSAARNTIWADELDMVRNQGYIAYFRMSLKAVAQLGMYEAYEQHGWTRTLASQTRTELLPEIVRAVTLAWYAAAECKE